MKNKSNTNVINVLVEEAFSGNRLDKFLSQRLVEYSRSRIKSLILKGYVSNARQKITDPSHRVKPTESYVIEVPAVRPAKPVGQKIFLNVIYEDVDLIVIDKPAGLVVHPAAGNQDMTMVNALIFYCGDSLSGIGGETRPGIVHRLDKDTSGLIVAAKNDIAHRGLAKQFAERSVERAYKAVVWGMPREKSGTIEGNIGRNPRNRRKMAIVNRGGKHAITKYWVEKKIGIKDKFWASLIKCRLQTGRTHQIRVHLTSIGNPIIGDPLYGARDSRKVFNDISMDFQDSIKLLKGQALHAYLIGFRHPITGEKIKFESSLPADIEALL